MCGATKRKDSLKSSHNISIVWLRNDIKGSIIAHGRGCGVEHILDFLLKYLDFFLEHAAVGHGAVGGCLTEKLHRRKA